MRFGKKYVMNWDGNIYRPSERGSAAAAHAQTPHPTPHHMGQYNNYDVLLYYSLYIKLVIKWGV
jgi:hypothetical protein